MAVMFRQAGPCTSVMTLLVVAKTSGFPLRWSARGKPMALGIENEAGLLEMRKRRACTLQLVRS